ncbi:MAG TPA: TadE/TadG family type IV pilus assembly protein [Acidobacteriaceae bacterium]|nr:TadE/TadG family type IV pilus assembly protein [Acidobacteriaceae bacterium]
MSALLGRKLRSAGQLCREDGSSLVEVAISSSVLLTVLLGIMYVCLALYQYHFVSEAAREASRYAMVRGAICSSATPNQSNCNATSDEIQTWTRGISFPGIDPSQVTVTTTWLKATSSGTPPSTTWSACTSGTCNEPGSMVRVVVSYPVSLPWANSPITVSSASEVVISQ